MRTHYIRFRGEIRKKISILVDLKKKKEKHLIKSYEYSLRCIYTDYSYYSRTSMARTSLGP